MRPDQMRPDETRPADMSLRSFSGNSQRKILFRRSHIRDVAMKRLRPINEYCRSVEKEKKEERSVRLLS
ncbi:SH3 and PX domain-containing protein 2A [Liparis tanakae]|uniref:SH3 and PX domain-containing protein 2A n=1 Tax=Liparis tanakae TaxID=230148 RepID=A0A4Z2EH04_9TELE|nr:SH3 and PX domain-containing protein 2A [Liparis tanakae]